MSKLKIGDLVRSRDETLFPIERKFKVLAIEPLGVGFTKLIQIKGKLGGFYMHYFEKVDPESLTKLEKVIYNLTNNQG